MNAPRTDSMLVLFGRLFWMLFGPAALLVSAALILTTPRAGWRTGADIVFWIALAGMIVGRYVEHRGGNPRTSTGEPATIGDLQRYAIVTAIVGSLIWVIANIVSNHILE